MFAKVVAERYARALLYSCPDLATIERVDDELSSLRGAWEISREIRDFLLNPKIPAAIKTKLFDQALGDKFSEIIMRLISLLIEKRRQDILPDIAERYSELTNRVRGVENAEIIIASPVPDDLKARLLEAVQRFSTRDVEISLRIDPSILGGVQIRMGDRLIDGSLKHRFDGMRRAMLAARLPRYVPE